MAFTIPNKVGGDIFAWRCQLHQMLDEDVKCHVSEGELACHDKDETPYPEAAVEDGSLEKVLAVFEAIREACGNKPIRINCAYRTPEHNAGGRGRQAVAAPARPGAGPAPAERHGRGRTARGRRQAGREGRSDRRGRRLQLFRACRCPRSEGGRLLCAMGLPEDVLMGTRSDFHQYVLRLLYRNGETGIEDLMGWLRDDIQVMWERGQIVSDKGQIHLPDDAGPEALGVQLSRGEVDGGEQRCGVTWQTPSG